MSKIRLVGYNESGHCGYCSNGNSKSLGLNCNLMRSSDYESLMVKGWRRCGSYYYKPDVPNSCCRLNTIRCDAPSFVPNKSQRKVLKKFQRFLEGTRPASNNKKVKRQGNKLEVPDQLKQIIREAIMISIEGIIEFSEDYVKITRNVPARAKQYGDYSIFSCISICSKNKQLRIEEVFEKLLSVLSGALENTQYKIKNTDKFHINLEDISPTPVAQAGNMEVDGVKHEYSSEIVSADFTEESYQLYRKYQIAIHKDPPYKLSTGGYQGFLCGKNLVPEPRSDKNPLGLGNFHQLHRIDGKLIAVGVLDFLPSGISAVYYFYDPDYQHLSLGVLGALKEIELIKSNISPNSSLKYYYMGFYINTCQKMRYKGEYLPSELLCPRDYVWVNIEKCLASPQSHDFKNLSQCSEQTIGTKDSDMDWTGVNYLEFVMSNVQFDLNGTVIKADQLNDRGKQYVLGMMTESQGYFSKTMLKRLVFKLNS